MWSNSKARPPDIMITLETPRLTLVPLSDEHLLALAQINGDAEVMRYIGSGLPFSLAEIQAMIERVKTRWREQGYSWWAMLRRSDGLMVGGATLQPVAAVPGAEMEIGWRLRRDCWGQGYASEAARRILEHARACGIPRLIAVAHPDNEASIAVMRRIGMQFRGLETHYNTTCATWVWHA